MKINKTLLFSLISFLIAVLIILFTSYETDLVKDFKNNDGYILNQEFSRLETNQEQIDVSSIEDIIVKGFIANLDIVSDQNIDYLTIDIYRRSFYFPTHENIEIKKIAYDNTLVIDFGNKKILDYNLFNLEYYLIKLSIPSSYTNTLTLQEVSGIVHLELLHSMKHFSIDNTTSVIDGIIHSKKLSIINSTSSIDLSNYSNKSSSLIENSGGIIRLSLPYTKSYNLNLTPFPNILNIDYGDISFHGPNIMGLYLKQNSEDISVKILTFSSGVFTLNQIH